MHPLLCSFEQTENYDNSNREQLVNISSLFAAKTLTDGALWWTEGSQRFSESTQILVLWARVLSLPSQEPHHKRQRSTAKRNEWSIELSQRLTTIFLWLEAKEECNEQARPERRPSYLWDYQSGEQYHNQCRQFLQEPLELFLLYKHFDKKDWLKWKCNRWMLDLNESWEPAAIY